MARLGLFPFLKVTVLWIAGILLYQIPWVQGISIFSLWAVTLSLGIILGYCLLPPKWQIIKVNSWFRAYVTLLILLSASILRSAYSQNGIQVLPEKQALVLELTEFPNLKKGSYRSQALILDPKTGHKLGSAQVYIYDSAAAHLTYGAQIQINRKTLHEINSSMNPGAFDYASFMAAKGIHYQTFLKKNDFLLLRNEQKQKSFTGLLQSLRKFLLAHFNYLPAEEAAIAKALVFGYKQELNEYVRDRFSQTGAMHILAVSGLHVGIIYIFFNLLFSRIFKHSKTRAFKVSGILMALWLYAFLAGLPPSVLRASIMFSVIALGKEIIRANNVYNNVLFSACLLLVFQPQLLFNVSFQLSYAAVFGIISFQPYLAGVWKPKYKLVNWLWVLVTVSFAAQLSTFPITLYYFHQFPWVFPFTNLIAIPGAMLVVNGGLLLPLFSAIPVLGGYYQLLFKWILMGLNYGIAWFSNWSFSHVEGVSIHSWEVLLLFIFTMSIYLAWSQRRKLYIYLSLSALLLQQSYAAYLNFHQEKEQAFVVFNTGFDSTYGLLNGDESKLVFNGSKYQHAFATEGYFIRKASSEPDTIRQIEPLNLEMGHEQIVIPAGRILTKIDAESTLILSSKDYASNYAHFPKEQIVFDSSVNPDWILDKFPNFAHSHFVQQSGAYIIQ